VALHYDLKDGIEVHALGESLVLSDFGQIAACRGAGWARRASTSRARTRTSRS